MCDNWREKKYFRLCKCYRLFGHRYFTLIALHSPKREEKISCVCVSEHESTDLLTFKFNDLRLNNCLATWKFDRRSVLFTENFLNNKYRFSQSLRLHDEPIECIRMFFISISKCKSQWCINNKLTSLRASSIPHLTRLHLVKLLKFVYRFSRMLIISFKKLYLFVLLLLLFIQQAIPFSFE